jgi:lactate permease
MAGRQLPFVSLLVPAWLVVTMSGWRGLRGVWPAVLVCGGSFALVQFLWSNLVGPELVDIAGGLVSIAALAFFCRGWQPRDGGDFAAPEAADGLPHETINRGDLLRAWMPWLFLSVAVILWGLAPVKAFLNGGPSGLAAYRAGDRPVVHDVLSPRVDVPFLHRLVFRDYPVVPEPVDPVRISDPAYRAQHAEAAQFTLNWASATGTAILIAALATALFLRVPFSRLLEVAGTTARRMRASLATIMLMLALGFVTRYGGTDATLGLAFTKTGALYPFFATLLGWLGVALTGSDTSSNVLFGSLQKITAEQLGFNPVLIVTANSTGGVMGKMIDAQSIVVSTAATGQVGQEGRILRFVFWHSLALVAIMGAIVMLQAYVFPWMIP